MRFRTEVKIDSSQLKINHNHSLLLIGSCFVEHMGKKLNDTKFNVLINPYGVLYNPLSISASLHEIVEKKEYCKGQLFNHQGLWHSAMHHSSFSNVSQTEVLEHINREINTAYNFINQSDYLVVTFGSAWVYHNKLQNNKIGIETSSVVGNCHKLPERYFNRRLISVSEITKEWNSLLVDLFSINPSMKIIFTVSPIRHLRDGLQGNQLSKSTLLLAIHELKKQWNEQVVYFPAYEIVLDELRDYRFFSDDMCHPSLLAIEYIWEKFTGSFLSPESLAIIEECNQINKALSHRPFNPESKEHQRFLRTLIDKIEKLSKRYPNLALNKELELCHTQLI